MRSESGIIYEGTRPPTIEELSNASVVALDIESTGTRVEVDQPLGVALSVDRRGGAYFPWGEQSFPWRMIEDDKVLKVGHNIQFDRSLMKKHNILCDNVADTMILGHMGEYDLKMMRYSLGDLYRKLYYQERIFEGAPREFVDFKGIGGLNASTQTMGEMCSLHARTTLNFWEEYEHLIDYDGLSELFWDLKMPMVNVLSDVELNGCVIDDTYLRSLGVEFRKRMDTLEYALERVTGVKGTNYNSGDQIAWLLFDKLGLQGKYLTSSGKRFSTDAKALESLRTKHPAVNLILTFRMYSKLIGTYVDGILERMINGRVHPHFGQAATDTGRLNSTDPNAQNIPKRKEQGYKIRRAFVAPEGHVLVVVDWNQLELRDLAIQSKDPGLIDAFNSGRDIHAETAIRAYGSASRRADGKTMNYQIVFGGGTREHRQKFMEAYPVAGLWIAERIRDLHMNGFAKTRKGRIRPLPNGRLDADYGFMTKLERDFLAKAERQCVSTHVQGSAAEEVQEAMVNIWNITRDTDIRMIMQVHDELLFEVPFGKEIEIAEVVKKACEKLRTLSGYPVDLTVDTKVGKNWKDLVKFSSWKEKTVEQRKMVIAA